MIPFVLLGSVALILLSLPIAAYQDMMTTVFGSEWRNILQYVRDGTFNAFSLILVITVSYSYAQEFGNHQILTIPIMASITALGSYIALLGISESGFSISYLGVIGVFIALLVSLTSTALFIKLSGIKAFRIRFLFDGANPSFSNAISLFVPAALTIIAFAVVNEALHYFIGIADLQTFIAILLVHLFWFFGIHGSNVLEPASQDIFVSALETNQQLVLSGIAPTEIFTKTFFDTFVLMGGCGSIICLIIAIFIVGRNKSQVRLSKLSVVPVLFNINELMVFGIPIVLNPIYLIPFIGVPLILSTVSFFSMKIGLVPYTTNLVEWTTPIFLSGYIATGSVMGSIQQLFNLAIGTVCYIPFVKLSTKAYEVKKESNLKKVYEAFRHYDEQGMASSLISRLDTVGSIARALSIDFEHDIDKQAVDLHYQPIVDADGKVVSVEALLRWNHSSYGLISPPLAIALAEEAGHIDNLGSLIFNRACKDSAQMKKAGVDNVTVCVNVSATQLENDNFTRNLETIFTEHGIRPTDIQIELTEQLALSNSLKITRQIEEISRLGIKLAMDDFGAGHSSLMYLKEYHFHTIKLDGSLVREVVASHSGRNIISTIVSLGTTLNYRVVAEFVETPEQKRILQGLGCELYQGYLFSKAIPIGKILEYIIQANKNAEKALDV
jgi:lactose/cellobiose-specific phosphotransferase system IIC component